MTKRRLLAVCIAALIVPLSALRAAETDIVGSVVKVYCEMYPYSYEAPWRLENPMSVTGSGAIIAGHRILTSAHVVADGKFIQVKRAGGDEKYEAEVEIVGHQCDLAVLKVNDPKFFEDAVPLEIGPLVALRDRVIVYGFSQGGEELSTTEGIVSRIEIRPYAHSMNAFLCGQIDAAINPGSSGGPVVKDERIVGIAFQAGRGQNISYMVPAPVIDHFLKDIEDGTYDGIPGLEVACQPMENPGLRAKHGMKAGQSGVLVMNVHPGSPAEGLIKPGDVITSLGGRQIANDATIEFRKNERTLFFLPVQEHLIGETIEVGILRDGAALRVPVKLTVPFGSTRLVPNFQYDRQPSYYIVGGLVFERLTANYLDLFEDGEPPVDLRTYYLYAEPTPDRRNIVVLIGILVDSVNVGYQGFTEAVIFKANGQNVSTLGDLVKAVETNQGPYHVFVDSYGREIVIDRVKAGQRLPLILQRYKIDSDRSEDLKAK
jgi:S1-C subfamily serine protease